ncbi:MAG: AMP-binding protein, partial [Cyanobacteria bacterium P01_C01_bin.72]
MNTASKAIAFDHINFDYINLDSLPQVWRQTASEFANTIALQDPHAKPEVSISYQDLYSQIEQFAGGLQALGIEPQAKIALFADNSPRWFVADQGIMTSGAVDVVRSSG